MESLGSVFMAIASPRPSFARRQWRCLLSQGILDTRSRPKHIRWQGLGGSEQNKGKAGERKDWRLSVCCITMKIACSLSLVACWSSMQLLSEIIPMLVFTSTLFSTIHKTSKRTFRPRFMWVSRRSSNSSPRLAPPHAGQDCQTPLAVPARSRP